MTAGTARRMWLVSVVVLAVSLWWSGARAEPQVPCYFIFGDSLVDNGNNNQLQSLARADYLPYGVDFGGPTGRFSNGKTTVDVVAELLGFDDFIPPYATARGQDVLKGVNFASAAAGIREETGRQLGDRITFSGQVKNYQNTVSQVVNLLGGEDQAANYLSKCIYSVGLGSNDYLNNYFMPQFYSTGNQFTPEEYADSLIHDYGQQLTQLVQGKPQAVLGKPQVPCFFIFGDSVADPGNNNKLPTLAKVNYKPYGIDFPAGPTGRFCNGRNIVDILAELLGFENYIPAFASANGTDILQGVNYASGAAGIRKESGKQLGARISMGEQLKNHRTTVSRIIDIFGKKSLAKNQLNQCLYSVGMGSNDYINNYFMPQYYTTSQKYTLEEYADVLIKQYTRQILKLHQYGARKVALVGLGLIGCTPDAIKTYGTNGSACVDIMNNASQIFNGKLVSLVDELNTNLTDSQFIYINTYGMGSGDATLAGFKVLDAGCCEADEVGQCVPDLTPCQNRSEYVFWDSFHPTEAGNLISASRTYTASEPSDTYPMDMSQLAELQINPQVNEI